MWRTQAVERMLLENVAGIRRRDAEERSVEESLRRARRAAWRAVLLDWAAIVVLVAVRAADAPILELDRGVEAIFAIGLLVIAVHSGFRLGQLEKLHAVGLVTEELAQRR